MYDLNIGKKTLDLFDFDSNESLVTYQNLQVCNSTEKPSGQIMLISCMKFKFRQ